jgi:hypothetical protein
MKRTIWTVVIVSAAAAATILLLRQPQMPWTGSAEGSIPTPVSVQSRDVRVQHELVTVARPATTQRAVRNAQPGPAAAPITARARQNAARTRPDKAALLVKASRAILGDGRYRPEPFPRAK